MAGWYTGGPEGEFQDLCRQDTGVSTVSGYRAGKISARLFLPLRKAEESLSLIREQS